jgi:nucleoside-diphosphate-sugar epimerase
MREHFDQRSVLVTGGLGFIGSTLALRLADFGARVVVLDNLSPHYGGNLFNIEPLRNKIEIHKADMGDRAVMQRLVDSCDYVFNLAGQTSHLDSMTDPLPDLEVNCAAQLVLLEACRTNNPNVKLVHASTRQIYGRPNYLPVDEKHPLRPVDVNGIHKLAGEQYFLLYHRVYGMRTSVLRLTNTIGPRMRVRDARQTFLGVWIRQVLERFPIDVWGGEQLRDFNDVDDVVNAFLLAATNPAANGDVFNLGSDEVVSLRQTAEMLIDLAGRGEIAVREFPPERKAIDIGDYYGSYAKIADKLDWRPSISLRETLNRTLAFFEEHRARYV